MQSALQGEDLCFIFRFLSWNWRLGLLTETQLFSLSVGKCQDDPAAEIMVTSFHMLSIWLMKLCVTWNSENIMNEQKNKSVNYTVMFAHPKRGVGSNCLSQD
jgi:hypothetical protein